MSYLLFCCYFLLLLWLVIKTPFFKKIPVPAWVLAALFAIKVAAGLYYGWFFSKMPDYKVQADTWRMFYESLGETRWLKTDPAGFAADLFRPRYQQDSSILASGNSYWNDIKSVLMVKLMAVLNLLSGGRYYINVLFFEYLSFFGPVAVSRLFISSFPGKKWLVIAGAFLFPSTLLWCSGFHKEGLLLSALGLSAWLVKQLLVKKDRQWVHGLLLVSSLFIAFLLRNYLVAFFISWSVAWAVAAYFPKSGNRIFPAMMVLLILFFSQLLFYPVCPICRNGWPFVSTNFCKSPVNRCCSRSRCNLPSGAMPLLFRKPWQMVFCSRCPRILKRFLTCPPLWKLLFLLDY